MMVNMMTGCTMLAVAVFVIQTACVASGREQLCYSEHVQCFTYDRDSTFGPACWNKLNESDCCDESGSLQSPINIPHPSISFKANRRLKYISTVTDDDECDGDEDDGYCYNRDIKLKGKMENCGVYPKFVPEQDSKVYLTHVPGKNKGKRYVMADIHFHSGKTGDYRQTENLLNGKSFDAEAHIVHYLEEYKNATYAKSKKDGIVVVSIFLSVTEGRESCAFNKILNQLTKPEIQGYDVTEGPCANITYHKRQNNECENGSLGVEKFCGEANKTITIYPNQLLSKTPKYLVFRGGLTTPTCSESVKWLVAKYPTRIKKHVIKDLANVETHIANEKVGKYGNLRPLQNVAGRRVKLVTFKRSKHCSGDDDDGRECDDDECECDDDGDDDEECNCDDDVDDDDCEVDDDKCDRDDDDRRNSMTLNWSMNRRGRKHERGDN